jgi:molecular chaperone DnaK (HSP70)
MSKAKYTYGRVGKATIDIEGCKGYLPFAIGVKTRDGITQPLVKRHTKLPVRFRKVYEPASDYDNDMKFILMMGDRVFADDNVEICSIEVSEQMVRDAPRPQYELSIDVAPGGKMDIYVTNKSQRRRTSARILFNTYTITAEQVRQLRENAEGNEESDARIRAVYDKMVALSERQKEIHRELWEVARTHIGLKNAIKYERFHADLKSLLHKSPADLVDDEAVLDAKSAELEEWAGMLQEAYDKVMAHYAAKIDTSAVPGAPSANAKDAKGGNRKR